MSNIDEEIKLLERNIDIYMSKVHSALMHVESRVDKLQKLAYHAGKEAAEKQNTNEEETI